MRTKTLASPQLLVDQRRQLLLSDLENSGSVSVDEAALTYGTSPDSIRRDLRYLDQQGVARRVRGGAVRRSASSTVTDRWREATSGQIACAQLVAERLVLRGGTIALDNGSTAVLIAERLASRDGLTVVTGNPAAAAAASANGVTVVALGGVVDRVIGGVVDATAVAGLRSIRCDVAVLGVCAVVDQIGVVAESPHEVAFKRALVAAAPELWVIATADKLGGVGAFVVADLDALSLVVTDADAAATARVRWSAETEVVRVPA